jgi:D-serine deaminase-like pyridoxal phosphate-dependent protein
MARTIAGPLNLTSILDEPVDWQFKGFPPMDRAVTVGTAGEQGWNALGGQPLSSNGDLLFPVLLLKERALQHNIDLMARYCRNKGVSLAPHAKTPMSPQIVQRQLEAGAWGITAATLQQVRVFRAFGVPRIILANQLLEKTALEWVAAELSRDPGFDFLFLVDSPEGVTIADRALAGAGPARPLQVLLELGAPGSRSGIRDRTTAHAVARAVWESPYLELAGVEGYEGAIHGETLEDTIALVDRFLVNVRETTANLARAALFDGREEIVVSVGGSLMFDRVVAQLAGSWDLDIPVRTVLRSGSYVTHDFDVYERLSPLAGRGSVDAPPEDRFRVALEFWAMVLSRPEPGLAIAGFGKRDAPYDNRLPVLFAVRRAGHTQPVAGEIEVTALNDQHAFLRLDSGNDLAVGDLVGLNVAHPCTSFDKWRLVPLVDDEYRVTGAIRTFF